MTSERPVTLGDLSLRSFRTYERLELALPPGLVVLAGPNGVGKTNLLEACAMLLTGSSPRTSAELRCIREGSAFLRIAGVVQAGTSQERRAVVLEAGRGKRLERDDAPVRSAADFAAAIPAVTFLPERLLVVRGAPARRRALLDRVVEQLEPGGIRTLREYAHVVTQRNALLRQAKGGRNVAEALAPWDEQLVTVGTQLRILRERVVAELVPRLTTRFEELTSLPGGSVSVEPRAHDIATGLAETRDAERRRGTTVVGPHLDDVRLEQAGRDLRAFGSTGEQRAALLAWSLATADLLREQRGMVPILLLDEPYAELDRDRRRRLTGMLEHAGQVVVTTTEPPQHLRDVPGVSVFAVSSGVVAPWTDADATPSQ